MTVAPFIEDEATLRKVRELGLHFGQGYRLTQPEMLNELAPSEQTVTGRTGAARR